MPDAVTLNQHFMAHGYYALGSGKIYHDRYHEQALWDSYLTRQAGKRDPQPTGNTGVGGIRFASLPEADDQDMNDQLMVDWAIEKLQADHDKPFFLAAGVWKPHAPWEAPQKYFDMYPLDDIRLPECKKDDLEDAFDHGRRWIHKWVVDNDQWKK